MSSEIVEATIPDLRIKPELARERGRSVIGAQLWARRLAEGGGPAGSAIG